MKIDVEKKSLYQLLGQVQGILEKRNIIPILANILLEVKDSHLNIYASDSELNFLGNIKVNVKEEGAVVLNGKKLYDIIKELPLRDIYLNQNSKQKIEIKQGDSVFQINTLKVSDFPEFPKIQIDKFQKIKTTEIIKLIDKILYCASYDESRYHLTGIYLEAIKKESCYRFVSTDGHRMSFADIFVNEFLDFNTEEGIIIPKKTFQEIKKIISLSDEDEEIEIGFKKPCLVIKFKSKTLTVRLIEGRYPDYKQLVPKNFKEHFVVSKEDFLNSLKRVSVLTSARFKGINFLFNKNGKILIKMLHPGIGEASESLNYKIIKGEEIEAKFNSRYMIDRKSVV